jgi:hypothetical protein
MAHGGKRVGRVLAVVLSFLAVVAALLEGLQYTKPRNDAPFRAGRPDLSPLAPAPLSKDNTPLCYTVHTAREETV